MHAAALAKLDCATPFYLDVSIADEGMKTSACLYQQRQGERHVLGDYNIILDPIEQKAPPCT